MSRNEIVFRSLFVILVIGMMVWVLLPEKTTPVETAEENEGQGEPRRISELERHQRAREENKDRREAQVAASFMYLDVTGNGEPLSTYDLAIDTSRAQDSEQSYSGSWTTMTSVDGRARLSLAELEPGCTMIVRAEGYLPEARPMPQSLLSLADTVIEFDLSPVDGAREDTGPAAEAALQNGATDGASNLPQLGQDTPLDPS